MHKNLDQEIFLNIDCESVTNIISIFIKKTAKQANVDGVVIGLSGGVDSSLVAHMCVEALGRDNVFGLILPYEGVNPSTDTEHGELVAKKLGIKSKYLPINGMIDTIITECGPDLNDKMAVGNLKARIRMAVNYYYANKMNKIVAGTGNKSEDLVGYFTKYGDGGVDFLPIQDLYKTQVWVLAKHMQVPLEIIEKAPSAGLWENQKDEDELGIDYHTLDRILVRIFEKDLSKEKTAKELNIDVEKIEEVFDRYIKNKHKITSIPSPQINKRTIEEISQIY